MTTSPLTAMGDTDLPSGGAGRLEERAWTGLAPVAALHGIRDVRVEERPIPRPAPHEVLVAVHAVGICGSDVHYYEHGRIGDFVVEEPMLIGHESAGVIIEVGAEVDPRRIGEPVALEPGIPCRRCAQCLAGRYNLCPDVEFFATPPIDGAIARYVRIDADFAHRAPDGLSAAQAAMAEPVSVGVWAARKAQISAADRVLVSGAGPIGLLCGQVALALGAARVALTDVSEHRLGLARELGLDTVVAGEPYGDSFDVLVECSGAQEALRDGLRAMAPAGRVVLVGMGADEVSIPVSLVQGMELWIGGIFRYANTYPTALRLIASGAVRVDPLITHRFTLEETEEALTIGRHDRRAIKAVVEPHRLRSEDSPEHTTAGNPVATTGGRS